MTKYLLTLIFVSYSGLALAIGNCFTHYGDLLANNYYGIASKFQFSAAHAARLERNIPVKEKKIALVNEKGDLFNSNHYAQYRLSGEQGEIRIKVYAPSRTQAGEEVVDFKIDAPPAYKEVIDEDRVLRTISLKQLYEEGFDEFSTYGLSSRSYILMPTKSKSKRRASSWEVLKVIGKTKTHVRLKDKFGKVSFIDNFTVFKNNFYITTEEKSLINEFFKAGGRGEVFYLNKADRSDYRYRGVLLKIDDISRMDRIVRVFFNEQAYIETKKVVADGYHVYLTSKEHGINAAHLTGVHPDLPKRRQNSFAKYFKNRDSSYDGERGLFLFTTSTTADVIVHEFRHEIDGMNKLIKHIRDSFKKMDLNFSNSEFRKIQSFIYEQRAYSTQFAFIRSLKKEGGIYEYQEGYALKRTNFEEYLGYHYKSIFRKLERYYRDPAVEVLAKYKKILSPEKYAELVEFIQAQFIENEFKRIGSPSLEVF